MECSYVLCPVYIHSRNSTYIYRARKNTGTHMRAPKRGCYSAAECHFLGPRSIGLLTAESTECS
jgi:hypothetical protein